MQIQNTVIENSKIVSHDFMESRIAPAHLKQYLDTLVLPPVAQEPRLQCSSRHVPAPQERMLLSGDMAQKIVFQSQGKRSFQWLHDMFLPWIRRIVRLS